MNLAGDAEQDYFVDGVTGSLTTDLSRMSGMLVIGRNTAFTYKNRPVVGACFHKLSEALSTRCGGDGVTIFYGMAKPVRTPLIGPARGL